MTSLKEKIMAEMVVDYGDTLERNFELAKKFIRIANNGKIDVITRKSITGKELIQLYLIGKIYAKEAGLCESEEVTNKELINELSIPEGSLLPWTKDLRDNKKITSAKPGTHAIPVNLIEKTLKEVETKTTSTEEISEEI